MLTATADRADDVLLFVAAFDGVLSDYQDEPARAHIADGRLTLLRRLLQVPGVAVAVISGRPLADLRSRVTLGDDAFYIGLHGFEIAGPQLAWTCSRAIDPAYQDRMLDVAARVQDVVSDVPGVRLECKGPVLALHTREAASGHVVWSRFQLLNAAADLVNTDAVRARRGHDVLELLPNVGVAGAEAVQIVKECVERRHHRPVFTIYVGEDVADDGVVDAVGATGVAAVVGRRTHNAFHLRSGDDVDSLIDALIEDRLQRQSPVG